MFKRNVLLHTRTCVYWLCDIWHWFERLERLLSIIYWEMPLINQTKLYFEINTVVWLCSMKLYIMLHKQSYQICVHNMDDMQLLSTHIFTSRHINPPSCLHSQETLDTRYFFKYSTYLRWILLHKLSPKICKCVYIFHIRCSIWQIIPLTNVACYSLGVYKEITVFTPRDL